MDRDRNTPDGESGAPLRGEGGAARPGGGVAELRDSDGASTGAGGGLQLSSGAPPPLEFRSFETPLASQTPAVLNGSAISSATAANASLASCFTAIADSAAKIPGDIGSWLLLRRKSATLTTEEAAPS